VNADPALAELTAPGGAFEVVVEPVLGVPMRVYKERLRSMRELVDAADTRGGVDFLAQGERHLAYDQHNALVRRAAAGLVRGGVGHGDRVAILSANSVEWVVAFWAVAVAGAVAVPLNAWWKADELQFALEDSDAALLLCDRRRWEVVRDVVQALPALRDVYVMDLAEPQRGARPGTELSLDEDPGELPNVAVDEDDLLAIMYTSGTTGQPKGATITHRQALANLQNIFCAAVANTMRGNTPPAPESSAQQATLLVVPLFHVTGCFSSMTLCYASGAKLVLMPPGRFDPDAAMATIERERVTNIGGVPTVMWRILESPRFGDYDLSSVTRISYGGAPAPPELVQRIREGFPSATTTLATAYGLTETASVATSVAGTEYVSHPGSVGRPVPTVELTIVDPDGHEVPTGETGEVWLKGPTIMMRGYWNRPDASADAVTDSGWLRTGDIGKVDEDGFLYLVDRAKDMIIRGGENVYCVEVEQVLFEHPDVIDAAVVGIPHRELGEEVKAVVQRRGGAEADPDEIRAWCADRLAHFKVPAYVEVRDEPLPRNPAGKVLKSLLRGDATAFATADDSAL
jgi:long-chain acyl-CoA synthetase